MQHMNNEVADKAPPVKVVTSDAATGMKPVAPPVTRVKSAPSSEAVTGDGAAATGVEGVDSSRRPSRATARATRRRE